MGPHVGPRSEPQNTADHDNVGTPTPTQLVAHLEALEEHRRSMLAQALRDEVGASLASAVIDLAWVEQHMAATSHENQRRLKRAAQSIADTLDVGRRILEGLRPSLLEKAGLFAALRQHLRTVCESAGIACCIQLPEIEPPFLEHVPIVIFRIVEEALDSVMLDESVTSTDLTITAIDRVLTVSIVSDGVSAAKRAADGNASYALLRLQLRAATLGGDLRSFGPSDRGTRITVRFSFERVFR